MRNRLRMVEGRMSANVFFWLREHVKDWRCCFRWRNDGLEEADPVPVTNGYARFRIPAGQQCRIEIHDGAVTVGTLRKEATKTLEDFRCWHTGLPSEAVRPVLGFTSVFFGEGRKIPRPAKVDALVEAEAGRDDNAEKRPV